MIYLQLFLSFLKVGFTSFGGLSMVPVITDEMTSHGWMTSEEIADIVAIAEMTPGPLGLNCSTFAGIRTAGLWGAIVAAIGVLTPSMTLGLTVAIFFEIFKENQIMGRIMTGVRPACIGLIAGVIFGMLQTNYLYKGKFSLVSAGIGALSLYLLVRRKWSIPAVIGISGAVGVLCFGVLGMA